MDPSCSHAPRQSSPTVRLVAIRSEGGRGGRRRASPPDVANLGGGRLGEGRGRTRRRREEEAYWRERGRAAGSGREEEADDEDGNPAWWL